MTAVLDAVSLVFRASGRKLLDEVTLSFKPGEKVALVGPNGAGKTTLLRILAGELRPASGQVRLKGREIASYSAEALARHRVVLSQHVTVAFPFTVAEVVQMGAGDRSGSSIAAYVDGALREVDLIGLADRVISTLSGGEQQRAHLARVLVQLACGEAEHGSGVLLLDEPTSSLDLRHQLDLLEAAARCAARGTTVIAILHDLNLAAHFAERVIMLDRGRVACDGTPQDTITDGSLREVFNVGLAVRGLPPAGMPFVLPHGRVT
jgi:iron complex transport system ATP-binding protein